MEKSTTNRILFVDDEPKILSGLQRMLHDKSQEWEMSFANGSDEALELLKEQTFDVAVLDVMMPKMNGLDLLSHIKNEQKTKDIEVIILTGSQEQNLKREALNRDAADLLNKPTQKEDLVARISNALRIKKSRDELDIKNYQLEQQLLQSQRMEIIGILSAGAVHDLNNLFQHMSGYSLLLQQYIEENEKSQKFITNFDKAIDRASEIVRQIHRFTKKSSNGENICNLNNLIEECIVLIRPSVSRQIKIHWENPNQKFAIKADSTQIYQVVMNLAINATQAIGRREGQVSIKLEHVQKQNTPHPNCEFDHCIKLSIRDTGNGMPQDIIDKIYDPLFTTKSDTGGSGLGLAVVNRIVTSYNGFIDVKSEENIGTEFTVYFPPNS